MLWGGTLKERVRGGGLSTHSKSVSRTGVGRGSAESVRTARKTLANPLVRRYSELERINKNGRFLRIRNPG